MQEAVTVAEDVAVVSDSGSEEDVEKVYIEEETPKQQWDCESIISKSTKSQKNCDLDITFFIAVNTGFVSGSDALL